MSEQKNSPRQAENHTKKTQPHPNKTQRDEIERLYTLMFGISGDVEQEYREYQEYWGVEPRNRA